LRAVQRQEAGQAACTVRDSPSQGEWTRSPAMRSQKRSRGYAIIPNASKTLIA